MTFARINLDSPCLLMNEHDLAIEKKFREMI